MFRDSHNYQNYFNVRPDPATYKLLHQLRTHPRGGAIIGAAKGEALFDGFLARHGKLKHTGGAVCPLRLAGRHCRGMRCECNTDPLLAVFDHRELWVANGRAAIFTAHPYQLPGFQAAALFLFCRRHGLEAMISTDSWYFHGQTLLVEITPANRQGAV